MKGFASFISWLFLPLFTPIYGLLLTLYLPVQSKSFVANESLFMIDPVAKYLFLLLFLVFIVLAPGMSFAVLRMNKTIRSFQMESKEERLTPIAIMTFYCMVLYLFLHFQGEGVLIPKIIKAMVLGGAIAGFIAYFITKKMKISLHGIGMGALFGFFYMYATGLEQVPVGMLISIVFLGGVVLSARLVLKAHSMKEISAGYLLGFATQIISIYFYP
ncbi:hypothetical protein [Brumimicrobium sp.]|uniref:hypothetical protein n=1 Tax=Brumimicrobium sp. TaxID=2029867 RepID=UPI003A92663B